MRLPVAILAGGLATRLAPLTTQIPKVLVDINGRPFAEHQLELLRQCGVTRVVFLVGHLGEMVMERLGNGERWGIRLEYVFDGADRKGTGGAVRNAIPTLGEQFLVMYGDSYLECDYAAIEREFLRSGRKSLMAVCRNDGQWDQSNVEFAGGEIRAYSKEKRTTSMRHIDYGLGAFTRSAFSEFRGRMSFDLADVYETLLRQGDLAAFDVPGRFYEIGSHQGLAETRRYLETHGRIRRRAVFLDRDGVINGVVLRDGKPHPPEDADALAVLPGVESALHRLKSAGYLLVVVTNQPDVARGTQTKAMIDRMHEKLKQHLPIDDFRVCYHDDADGCECRKPASGLLLSAARDFDVDLSRSVMVGDRWRDIEAGRGAGCATVFVDMAYRERTPERPDAVVRSLAEAADWILDRPHAANV